MQRNLQISSWHESWPVRSFAELVRASPQKDTRYLALGLWSARSFWCNSPTPNVCRRMAFWALLKGFRPLFYLLWSPSELLESDSVGLRSARPSLGPSEDP